MIVKPLRGQVWLVQLDPTIGREQAKKRPALILSMDQFNEGPFELAIVIPITSKKRNFSFHIPVYPPEGGLVAPSYVMCEQVRSVSIQRLSQCLGSVDERILEKVKFALTILLGF